MPVSKFFGSLLFLFLCLAACKGPTVHKQGERQLSVRASHGTPIVGKAISWDGNGRAPTFNASVRHRWFVHDRVGLGLGLTVSRFDQSDGAVIGGEFLFLSRTYVFESNGTGLFWDLDGGYLQTTKSVPENSTPWNFTFAFGPGFETPLTEDLQLLGGAQFHHLSNAEGRMTPRNESQNEFRVWLGVGWTF